MCVTSALGTLAHGNAIAGSVGGYRFDEFEMGQDIDVGGTNKLALAAVVLLAYGISVENMMRWDEIDLSAIRPNSKCVTVRAQGGLYGF